MRVPRKAPPAGPARWRAVLLATLLVPGLAGAHDLIAASGFDEPAEGPYNRDEAARFLIQATFGPTRAEIDRLAAIGYHA